MNTFQLFEESDAAMKPVTIVRGTDLLEGEDTRWTDIIAFRGHDLEISTDFDALITIS